MQERKANIRAQYIRDDKYRKVSAITCNFQVCFSKRKRGLLKKAMEIVMMTGCQVLLTMYDPENRKVTSFRSTDAFRERYLSSVKVEECFTVEDVSLVQYNDCQYFRFFQTENGEIRSKHILNANLVEQAVDNGELQINYGRQAKSSVDDLISEMDIAQKDQQFQNESLPDSK